LRRPELAMMGKAVHEHDRGAVARVVVRHASRA
jgi:hypothetical protein